MKPNYATKQMRVNHNSESRKEQFRLQALFKEYAPNLRVAMEYPVYSLGGSLISKIDFVDLDNKIAYRLRSAMSYHDSARQTLKDELQEQAITIMGWIVVDVLQDSKEWYWLWK